jgi:hypothetical protein
MPVTIRRPLAVLCALFAIALAAAPLAAQTILVVVHEAVGGAELAQQLPTREGLESSLFEKGFIVFDTPVGSPRENAVELIRVARSAGAQAIVQVEVDYRDAPLAGSLTQITGKATFSLIDVATGAARMKGAEEANNRDREKLVTREGLGREIGTLVAARVVTALGGARAVQ